MLANLSDEWKVLQQAYDQYEYYSLMIKLFTVAMVLIALVFSIKPIFSLALLIVLWGQDAIWKTFQMRIENRLLIVETGLAEQSQDQTSAHATSIKAFQFNREFAQNRQGFIGLLAEYVKNMCRPTIAYPYILLIGVLFVAFFL